uniref:JmjC domain-containing protein 7 n=1 Tax=Ciona intestinalis TaxID=7719 RepID=F6Y9P0_CIOIN|nr:jmjC domain-containing protein 7 [Ciona intestinalis]XP_026694827.1 jmjC domain-containing protein 7 [Ciona intestinalis]|eukprot:XP_009861744.1 jmjC domain-containing protein 7 [Ciona intestinalis]
MIMFDVSWVIISIFMIQHAVCKEFPKGHLQYLGEHQAANGDITTITADQITSLEFYNNYVAKNKPLLIKQVLQRSTPVLKWTDQYLKEKFGKLRVNVDNNKQENRLIPSSEMEFQQFLSIYLESKTHYMISTMNMEMQKEFPLPTVINCDGFVSRFQDFVMWFSGGNTRSKLHYDNVENMYCQISGTKHWFIVDPADAEGHIVIDHPEGAFSGVNVTSVDMLKYPGMQGLQWWSANLTPGDCIYMPLNWWHQVTSPPSRNMAINIWWAPVLEEVVNFPCQRQHVGATLSDFNFVYGEWIRYNIGEFIKSHGSVVNYTVMHDNIVHEHTGVHVITKENFDLLDINGDGDVTIMELLSLPPDIVHKATNYAEIGALNTNGESVKYADDEPDDDVNYYQEL